MKKSIRPGDVVERWTVIEPEQIGLAMSKTKWICQCECGTRRPVNYQSLVNRWSKSCGCLKAELARGQIDRNRLSITTHGHTSKNTSSVSYGGETGEEIQIVNVGGPSAEYTAWQNLKKRASDLYNGLVLTYETRQRVEEQLHGPEIEGGWERSFEDFLKDVGPKPRSGMRLKRINHTRGYVLGNVEWR